MLPGRIRNYRAWPGLELSPRMVTVIRMVAAGMSHKEIARELGLKPRTIEAHCAVIKARLGARNITHAAVLFDRMERTP